MGRDMGMGVVPASRPASDHRAIQQIVNQFQIILYTCQVNLYNVYRRTNADTKLSIVLLSARGEKRVYPGRTRQKNQIQFRN